MQEKKTAWVYTRIDSPEDATGSLKRQDQKLTEYVERMGWESVGHSQVLGAEIVGSICVETLDISENLW